MPEVVEHGMQKHGVGLAFSGSIGSLVERTSVGELGDKVSSVLQRAKGPAAGEGGRGVFGRRDSGQRWEKTLGGGQVDDKVENSSVSGLGRQGTRQWGEVSFVWSLPKQTLFASLWAGAKAVQQPSACHCGHSDDHQGGTFLSHSCPWYKLSDGS